MSRSRIALIIAMMFAVPAGVVALEQSAADAAVEMSEPAQEALAAVAEPVTGAEPAEADATPADTTAQSEPAVQAATQPEVVVQPTARIQRVTAGNAFPRNDEVGATLLPRLLAYLERVDQRRSHLIALGDAFPAGDTMGKPLPALVAYLDRADQARIAAAQPQPVARTEAAPATAETSVHAAGTEALVSAHALQGR